MATATNNVVSKMRNGGKSFHSLLKALVSACEGKDVLYVCFDKRARDTTFKSACNIIEGSIPSAIVRTPSRIVYLGNEAGGGSVMFIDANIDVRALKGLKKNVMVLFNTLLEIIQTGEK